MIELKRVAFLPSNQVDNGTAAYGYSESDLQYPIAIHARDYLREVGIQSEVFHIPEIAISSSYPKFRMLYKMCQDARAWNPDIVILNHSDSAANSVRGLLSLADAFREYGDTSDYLAWTRRYHSALTVLNGIGEYTWTTDQSFMGFTYSFYNYLDQPSPFRGWPLIVELANHSNKQQAEWMRDNPGVLGENLAKALFQSFGMDEEGEELNTLERNAIFYTAVRSLGTHFDIQIDRAERKGDNAEVRRLKKKKAYDVLGERLQYGLIAKAEYDRQKAKLDAIDWGSDEATKEM